MSGGTTSLDQVLPSGGGFVESWSYPAQPIPQNEVSPESGWANDASAGNVLHARDVLLEGLEPEYVFEAPSRVRAFLRTRPTAITLLLEAAAHLNEAFGEDCVKGIRIVSDGSEGASAFGIVFWPGRLEQGRAALASFDQRWWLRNCNRAAGVVNFNIELT